MRENRAYWIGGTLIALFGVALVRLLAPELAGTPATLATAAGYALVVVGMAIVTRAMRRRPARTFVSPEEGSKTRSGPAAP